MPDPTSIIAITREHIGDLVCTTPALRTLRRRFPNAYLAVEVGERAAEVLRNNPYIDEVIVRPDRQGLVGKLRFIHLLRRRRFDVGIVLDNCTNASLYLWLGGVPRRVGMVRKKRFSRLLTDRVTFDRSIHETIDNFSNVVGLLCVDRSDARTEVFPDADDRKWVKNQLYERGVEHHDILIGFNPGASMPSNRWLPERFAELGSLFQGSHRQIVVLGGQGDREMAEQIQKRMPTSPIVLTGQLTLMQLAATLERCSVVVTGDTGPMHLALAVGTPVVALFGPADPRVSGPGYLPGNRVIRKGNGCLVCDKFECRDDRRCMRAISAEEVAEAVEEVLLVQQAQSPGGISNRDRLLVEASGQGNG